MPFLAELLTVPAINFSRASPSSPTKPGSFCATKDIAAALKPTLRARPNACADASASGIPRLTSSFCNSTYDPAPTSVPCCTAPVATAPRTAPVVMLRAPSPRPTAIPGNKLGSCSATKLSNNDGSLTVSAKAVFAASYTPSFSASFIFAERVRSLPLSSSDFIVSACSFICRPAFNKPVSEKSPVVRPYNCPGICTNEPTPETRLAFTSCAAVNTLSARDFFSSSFFGPSRCVMMSLLS